MTETKGMTKIKRLNWQVWTGIGLFVVAFLAMTQFRVQQNIIKDNVANMRSDDLVGTLVQLEQANEQLSRETQLLRTRLEKVNKGQDITRLVEDELNQTKLRAGLIALQGPGMQITLADSESQQEAGIDPNNYYIHESFIREIVNAFWTGGAEAVSVNEKRLIATSEILCGGTTIFINGELVSPPYVVKAIGDPNNLRTSINMDVLPMLSSLQQEYGIRLDVQNKSSVTVPAYKENVQFKFAKPQL